MRTQVMHEPAVASPWLEHSSSDESDQRTPLDSFPFRIGRKESSDFCIDSTRVSREHAVITRHGKKYHIHDLGSTNGTFVNGQRVQEAVLCDGDQIMIAEAEFTFYSGAPVAERDSVTQVIASRETHTLDPVSQIIFGARRMLEVSTRRGLRTMYQPIVELETGAVFGHEALAASGTGEAAQPRCEQWTGQIESRAARRLWRLSRRMAIEEAASLPEGFLFVAVAAAECDGLWLVNHLCQLRDLAGARQLAVEIPDGAVRDDADFFALRAALRNANICVAFDGFASGKAQIDQRKEVAPDFLKLAPSLLGSIRQGQERQRQVQLMVRASQDLGAKVIATGIDSEADLEVCQTLKCALVQGELFGRPRSASALAQAPRSHHRAVQAKH